MWCWFAEFGQLHLEFMDDCHLSQVFAHKEAGLSFADTFTGCAKGIALVGGFLPWVDAQFHS